MEARLKVIEACWSPPSTIPTLSSLPALPFCAVPRSAKLLFYDTWKKTTKISWNSWKTCKYIIEQVSSQRLRYKVIKHIILKQIIKLINKFKTLLNIIKKTIVLENSQIRKTFVINILLFLFYLFFFCKYHWLFFEIYLVIV